MQEKTITHGSLFSGSGGFDEAARMNGIKTLWCSEIEPFPLRVLKKNFPDAKQLGDISQINGAKIEPVDIISGGSPCQDMSIAGNRDGLDGERSVLFHQQIRIVKEMREKRQMDNIQDTCFGRTSPEHSAVTKAKTSEASCKLSSASQVKTFLYLDLRGGASGAMQEQSWAEITSSHGEPWMHNTGEGTERSRTTDAGN